jgi:hypothetical protein
MHMSLLSSKLDRLEARLQTLIEGRFARLLPAREYRDEFVRRLVAAMKSGSKPQPEGFILAPDTYILLVHPDLAIRIGTSSKMLAELGVIIQDVGIKTGLTFIQPPQVRLSPNLDVGLNSIEVIARINQEGMGQTVESTAPAEGESLNLPPNAFLIVNGGRIFPLDQTVVNIGRRSDNDLVVDDSRVSRVHAQLRAIRGKYVISDLDSTGGTRVNGQRVTQQILCSRDVISLAGVPLVYGQDEEGQGKTQEIKTTGFSSEDDKLSSENGL